MRTAADHRTFRLGDFVIAAFDETEGLEPSVARELVSRAVSDVLLRSCNERLLRALRASRSDEEELARDDVAP